MFTFIEFKQVYDFNSINISPKEMAIAQIIRYTVE